MPDAQPKTETRLIIHNGFVHRITVLEGTPVWQQPLISHETIIGRLVLADDGTLTVDGVTKAKSKKA